MFCFEEITCTNSYTSSLFFSMTINYVKQVLLKEAYCYIFSMVNSHDFKTSDQLCSKTVHKNLLEAMSLAGLQKFDIDIGDNVLD